MRAPAVWWAPSSNLSIEGMQLHLFAGLGYVDIDEGLHCQPAPGPFGVKTDADIIGVLWTPVGSEQHVPQRQIAPASGVTNR